MRLDTVVDASPPQQERRLSPADGRAPAPLDHAPLFPLWLALSVGAYLVVVLVLFVGACRLVGDHVSFNLFGHAVTLRNIHAHLYLKFVVLSLIVPALLMIEFTLAGWDNSSLRQLLVGRSRSSMIDLSCFLLDQTPLMTGFTALASLGMVLISARLLHGGIERLTGVDLSLAWVPFGLRWVGYALVYSLFDYWGHRLDHTRRFWPLHRYHHAMDEFCLISSVRVHPAAFTRIIQQALPAALVGATPQAMIELNVVLIIVRYVIHSRIDSNFGWIGRYLLQSPNHHRRHHSLAAGALPGHYGLVPLWDHLFGTWEGEATQTLPIGVIKPYRQSVWLVPDLWRDYVDFWRGLASFRKPQSVGPSLTKALTASRHQDFDLWMARIERSTHPHRPVTEGGALS